MDATQTRRNSLLGDLSILLLLALARLVLYLLVDGQYGFHRDELATLDDARYLDWGYVVYPPFTPFVARIALELFGPSLVGVRFFAALAQVAAMVLVGLMARELGGGRSAQFLAALAVSISFASLISGALFMYVSFDYLWWVLLFYLLIRLLNTGDERLWLAIGATVGMGMMTKYTMAFAAFAVAVCMLLTPARRYLLSRWLWGGAAIALLIFLPNLIWQIQHGFVSMEFLASIHARDIRIGRTGGFLVEQLYVPANPLTIPLWGAGIAFLLFSASGRRYRLLGWVYLLLLLIFFVSQGRSYYLSPAYPMLLAAGAVVWERWVGGMSGVRAGLARWSSWSAVAVGGAVACATMLPIAPIGSPLWDVSSKLHDNFVEEVGWTDLVETVAGIYAAIPENEKARTGILAGNYGEAGAVDLYGPAYGLPRAISGVNSYWLRGYGDPPPETLIVIGFPSQSAERVFDSCHVEGRNGNRYGVANEESRDHPEILVCRGLRLSWPELWSRLRGFG